jgi:hypothetical protein
MPIQDWRGFEGYSSASIPDWRRLQQLSAIGVGFWPKLPDYQITHLPISVALCLRPSARPPPGIDALLQTKGESSFDRAVTGRSKLFFKPFWALIWLIAERLIADC